MRPAIRERQAEGTSAGKCGQIYGGLQSNGSPQEGRSLAQISFWH